MHFFAVVAVFTIGCSVVRRVLVGRGGREG